MVLKISTIILLISMLLVIIRSIKGPSIFDRILAVNIFGSMSFLLLLMIGYVAKRPEFSDIAIVYALISYVGTVVILKFIRYRNMAIGMKEENKNDS